MKLMRRKIIAICENFSFWKHKINGFSKNVLQKKEINQAYTKVISEKLNRIQTLPKDY